MIFSFRSASVAEYTVFLQNWATFILLPQIFVFSQRVEAKRLAPPEHNFDPLERGFDRDWASSV